MLRLPKFPKTCSKVVRDYFLSVYPGLGKNQAYWRMLLYLMYPTCREEECWYLGHDVIDFIARKKTNAIDFLSQFQRDVLPNFSWDDPRKGKARTITCAGLSDVDYDVLNVGAGKYDGGRVYWEDGKKWTFAKQAEDNSNTKNAMLAEAENAQFESQKTILTYHANLSSRLYSLLISKNKKYLDALALDKNSIAYRQAEAICELPKPIYHTVSKTARLYPGLGRPSLTSCNKIVRRALTVGCYEVDLANAHLAIIAKAWHVPTLNALLLSLSQQNKKVWQWLSDAMEVIYSNDVKAALKKAAYTLCYGGGLKRIYRDADKLSGIPGFGKKLLRLPVMQEILTARKKAMAEAKYKFEEDDVVDEYTHEEVRSLLACDVQAIEQDLITEVYKSVEATERCSIIVYSYDGVTLTLSISKEKIKSTLARIKRKVDKKAQELGIITTLEVEEIDI